MKKVLIVLIFVILFPSCGRDASLNADTVNNNVELGDITSESSDIKNIMQKIDLQVKKIKDRINFNKDYYNEDLPVFRHFENGIEQELFVKNIVKD